MSSQPKESSTRATRSNHDDPNQWEFVEDFALRIPLESSRILWFDNSLINLSNDKSTAKRVTKEYRDVYLLLSSALEIDQFIVIQILETDLTLVGGLRLYIRHVNRSSPLIYGSSRLIYGDSKSKPQDYFILWLSENGLVNVMKNNDKKLTQYAPPREWKPGSQIELLADMYGSVVKLSVFVGDRKNAEPFPRIQLMNNSGAPSISHTNVTAGNTANGLSSVNPGSSDSIKAFLICELYGFDIIPTGVEFTQNNSAFTIVCQNTSNNAMASSQTSSHVKKNSAGGKYESITDGKLCEICVETEINAVLIPCGHMCLCYQCAEKVRTRFSSTCPICRSEVKQTQKVYLS